MGNLRTMNWLTELLDSVRDKFVLERLDEKRLLNLIIQRIINKIENNNMDRIIFYISELIYDGHMNTTKMWCAQPSLVEYMTNRTCGLSSTQMTHLIRVLCDYKRYKTINTIFKNRLAHYGMVDFVLNIAYNTDDIQLLKTVIRNHTNDDSSVIDMIYQSIAKGAQKIVIFLLRTFKYYSYYNTDDILIACIDMEMFDVVYYILNMGVVSDIDNVFTAICSVNNLSLVKKYMMLFPNLNTMNGLMIATANNYTDIVNFIQQY